MKRALKKRVKAVLNNNPSDDDAPVKLVNVMNPKVNRRVRTKAAMIGLAISMGATSLLVTRQSDQAQAAVPVGSQKAFSSIPAVPDTEVKFASTKLESQAVSSASVPENPVIVEPTAVSQVPGLEAKWQVAASGMSLQVPASNTFSQATTVYKNSTYLKPKVAQGLNNTLAETNFPTVNNLSDSSADGVGSINASLTAQPQTVATSGAANSEINAELKAQQEFALNRLQEKSNRLRKSLAQLRSGETKNLSQADMGLVQPTTVVEKTVLAQSDTSGDASKAKLISRLKQKTQTTALVPTRPTVIASSTHTAYQVKPGDTLAAIASRYKTSVSQLVKANNLNNPNELQISQKLIIPAVQVEAIVASKPTFVESSNTPHVATSHDVNIGSANSYLPTSQSPTIADNSSVAAPTPVIVQIQANSATPDQTAATPVSSYGVGGDIPVPQAFAEMQQPKTPINRVASVNNNNNDRLRGLQAEIQRLQQKYRAQQSGNLIVPAAASETNNAAMLTPISSPNNFIVPKSVVRPNNNVAIQIPVPTPIRANYSFQPIKSQYRATMPANEPVNPDFLPNLGSASQWTPSDSPSGNPSGTRVKTPAGRVNASDSLGKMRGTTVSPQMRIPPLAAVDQYLPKPIDETIPPPSSSSIAYTWPAKGTLTSGYGWRWGRLHKGIDVANSTGTPVVASADGTIEKAGWNNGGYGNLVDIRHPDGSMTRYGHNSKILVQTGQHVHQGETIALMGSTGHSTGPHSHFEIHPTGKDAVNPIAFLPNRL